MIVSNNVLNSVVVLVALITAPDLSLSDDGSAGDRNEMYLLPNTVVARNCASTLAGIMSRYRVPHPTPTWPVTDPPSVTTPADFSRPIGTPLKVTFDPGSIDNPARSAITTRAALSSK